MRILTKISYEVFRAVIVIAYLGGFVGVYGILFADDFTIFTEARWLGFLFLISLIVVPISLVRNSN